LKKRRKERNRRNKLKDLGLSKRDMQNRRGSVRRHKGALRSRRRQQQLQLQGMLRKRGWLQYDELKKRNDLLLKHRFAEQKNKDNSHSKLKRERRPKRWRWKPRDKTYSELSEKNERERNERGRSERNKSGLSRYKRKSGKKKKDSGNLSRKSGFKERRKRD
jgi:hypothetical protein